MKMPGRNRSVVKPVKVLTPNVIYSGESKPNSMTDSNQQSLNNVPGPKHFPMPDAYSDNETIHEIFVTVFGIIALATQYLNLYRTVWWLPHSYTNTAMNFYLIDPHLVGFSIIMLSRRCLWIFFKLIFSCEFPDAMKSLVGNILKILIFLTTFVVLIWCGYNIMLKQTQLDTVLYLCYPLFIYFVLFGFKIAPFMEIIPWSFEKSAKGSIIRHNCSMSADVIREEVNSFKDDFNHRLKQLMYNAFVSAYYTSFIPCCFAQSVLHYDLTWASQHALFVLVSSFTMYYMYCFPSQYCDTLHRSALHLGRWNKLEPRSTHVPYSLWSTMTLWHQGALVKHCKELFRAEGSINAAEPGNSTHSRFYTIFVNPSVLLSLILAVEVTLVLTILILLINSSEWYKIISLGLILFSNYYTLFKLSREYLMLERVYHAEEVIQGRNNND